MKKNIKIKIVLTSFLVLGFPFFTQAKQNYLKNISLPNDTYYNQQWYLKKINSNDIWDTKFHREVVVAVIDSGVQITHPDLHDNIWINKNEIADNGLDDDNNGYIDDIYGWDFVHDTSDPSPKISPDFIPEEVSHGTIVAGILSAVTNNRQGVAGLALDAKIMPLLALDDRGSGNFKTVIRAIDYAIDNGADIINLSFVGKSYNAQFEAVIRRAYKSGIFVVAAAGNDNEKQQGVNLDKHQMYPVCNDGYYGENMVFGVAATDALDQKTSFSGYGKKCVDISAPGVSIFSTSLFSPREKAREQVLDKYYDGYWDGTSMATPMVSATAALIVGVNPSLNRQEVADVIKGSSDYIERLNPKYYSMLGAGRLNVGRAISMAKERLTIKNVKIINAPFSGTSSNILVSDFEGKNKKQIKVLGNFFGGANVATGDIDGDGSNEIIVGAGFSGGPLVQIFSKNYKLLGQFFAYNKFFRGGVNVAVGDVNGDGIDDIVTGAGPGGGPHVRVFNKQGELLGQFFAYNKFFRGGVNVAVGDVNGDGIDDIVTGAGPGGGPHVRIFKLNGKSVGQFFAYDNRFRGGVNVATADIDGGLQKHAEIITSPASKGRAHIRIFDHTGHLISDFFAYGKKYKGRTSIATGDIDRDGLDEIITGAGPGGTPHVIIFKAKGTLLNSYMAYSRNFSGGVNVAVIGN